MRELLSFVRSKIAFRKGYFIPTRYNMIFLLIFCALVAFYFYARKCNNYWNERGVRVVKTNFIFGMSFDFVRGRRSLEEIHEDLYKAANPDEPYFGMYNVLKPQLFIRDPELIHQITVKDFSYFHDRQKATQDGGRLIYSVAALEGDEWKSVRNKLTPTFSASKMKKMYGLIEECAEMLTEQHFRPLAQAGKPMDVREAMARFALDVIGKCAFGMQFNTLSESDNLYREVGKTLSAGGWKNNFRLLLQFINPKLLKLFGMKVTTDEVENFFFNLLHAAEESRRKEPEHRGDFLQLMLDLKDANDDKFNHLFSENHVASNLFIFYFAGHETTSLTLSFALYELTMQPDIQEKLRREIRKARENNNGVLDYDTVKNIPYLEMVISETLRLHGPVGFMNRLCTETYKVPDSSFLIKAGEMLTWSISGMHKDEKYFPDPLKFDPERFSEENIARMNPYVYQPFGAGPRICLGLRFAKLEMKICLANIISRFKFSRCAKTEVPIVMKTGGFFHSPENGIWLAVDEV